MLTLHGIHCVHTSMHVRKIKIHLWYLHFIFTLFLFITCEISDEEKLWLLRSTAVSMTWRLNVLWPNQLFYLRNKLNFSEVRGSMNVIGHVQSKWRSKGVMLTMHGTRCVHTVMNLRKIEFISYTFTLFYIVSIHYLWNFDLNLANKRRRKVIIRRVWVLRPTAITMTWRRSNVTSANQLLHLIRRRLRVMSRERVPFICVWTSSVQNRFI